MHLRTLIRTEPGGPNVELKTWQHISGALAVSLVSEFKPRGDGALDGERELVPLPDREITMAGGRHRHLGMYRITTPGQANGPALTVGLYVEGAGPYVLWERNPEEYDVLSLLVLPDTPVKTFRYEPLTATN